MIVTRSETKTWSKSAREWWAVTTDTYELTPSEMLIAREVCRGLTRLDAINSQLQGAPLTVQNRFGETVTAPLVTEQRMLSQSVTKLIGTLRLPEVAGDTEKVAERTGTTQRRSQVRGSYSWRPEVI